MNARTWHHWLTTCHPIANCSTCRAVREFILKAQREAGNR